MFNSDVRMYLFLVLREQTKFEHKAVNPEIKVYISCVCETIWRWSSVVTDMIRVRRWSMLLSYENAWPKEYEYEIWTPYLVQINS